MRKEEANESSGSRLENSITEHTRALEKSEEKFRAIFENSNDMISYVDRYGKVLDVNKRIEDILGYKREEVIGKNFAKLGVIKLKNLPTIITLFADTIRNGKVVTPAEVELKHKNGSTIFVEVSTSFIRKNGKVEGVVNLCRDITERKKAEKERTRLVDRLKEAKKMLDETKAISENIVEAMPASILVFDKSLRLISANKNFYQKMGKKESDVVGKTIDYIFYPVIDVRRIGVVDRMKEVLSTENPHYGERISYHHRLFFYRIIPLRDNKGNVAHVVLIMEDITEVTELEQEVIEANKKLESAIRKLKTLDKMKDEFLSIISHELKTPLTPIKGYLELLRDEDIGKINKKQRDALEISLHRAEHLKRMIDDIVDISKIEAKKMKFELKRIDLNNVIENVIRDMKFMADEKQMEILRNVSSGPIYVKADETRMAQVFSNIIDNSIKFSNNGDKITINVGKEDGFLHVKISDTGRGIPKKYQKKIFERLYQVDTSSAREFSGMGLGLSICEKIINEHKGKIWVESTLGKGSTFHFTLPTT